MALLEYSPRRASTAKPLSGHAGARAAANTNPPPAGASTGINPPSLPHAPVSAAKLALRFNLDRDASGVPLKLASQGEMHSSFSANKQLAGSTTRGSSAELEIDSKIDSKIGGFDDMLKGRTPESNPEGSRGEQPGGGLVEQLRPNGVPVL